MTSTSSMPDSQGPNPEPPHWKQDFDVDWSVTDYVSRREFTRFLGLSSAGMAIGTTAAAVAGSLPKQPKPQVHKVLGRVDEFKNGLSRAFEYPTKGKYALVVRHDDGSFSAFGQKCPHLGCAVYYEKDSKKLECPCHEGFFNPHNGEVISGPPQRGLEKVIIEIAEGLVWAKGGGN